MDFGLVANLVRSNSASNNGGTLASETDADVNKPRLYGSAFLNKDSAAAEDDLPPAKAARISSCGGDTAKVSLHECSNSAVLTQQMLSFSSPDSQMLSFSAHNAPTVAFPFVRSSSGYTSMHGVRGPFTPSQWMELEHQALIYKYITANVPIPSYLLIPIRKALESSGFSCFSLLRPNALGWGGFHLGFSKTDPEPGRCRRTDGKKWRCSRDAVADQKYCERHMNRGRHRSRKPVESASGTATTKATPSTPASVVPEGGASKSLSLLHHHQQTNNHTPAKTSIDRCIVDKETAAREYQHTTVLAMTQNAYTEFGSVCSDALLNPLNRSSSLVSSRNHSYPEDERKSEVALRQFIDEWPKNQSARPPISWPSIDPQAGRTQLSISTSVVTSDLRSSTASPTNEKSREFEATQMGLGVGTVLPLEQGQRQNSWVPISWEPSVGGPLGEALHTTGECNTTKALNLMENRLPSSPLGVLRGAFGSLSNSIGPGGENSKTLDGASFCNGLIGPGLMLPSLPAL